MKARAQRAVARLVRAGWLDLLPLLAALLAFWPVLDADFLNWDDRHYVSENPALWRPWPRFLAWAATSFHAANWHPLSWLSHRLDWIFWGLDPRGHHLTNLLLHALDSVGVAWLGARLVQIALSRAAGRDARGADVREMLARRVGCVTGLLFAVHPLHVESVAWIAERKDLLCAFFYLLAVLDYLRVQRAGDEANSAVAAFDAVFAAGALRRHALGLFWLVCALASKPMAVSLPCVLLLLDVFPLRRLRWLDLRRRRALFAALLEKLPHFILVGLGSWITFRAQRAGGAVYSSSDYPFAARIAVAAQALLHYLSHSFWPRGLLPYYPFPSDASLLAPLYLVTVLSVLAISLFAFWRVATQPIWLAAWGSYVVLLLPTLGLVKAGRQAMADRYAYLPSVIPLLLLATGLVLASERLPRRFESATKGRGRLVLIAVVALLVLAASGQTRLALPIWRSSVPLWQAVCGAHPADARLAFAWSNLGEALAHEGRQKEALEAWRQALELDSALAGVWTNIGNARARLGQLEAAQQAYRRALEAGDPAAKVWVSLGNVYDMQGHYDHALDVYARALDLESDNASAHYNSGIALEHLGRSEDAKRAYRRALVIAPAYAKAAARLRALEARSLR